jgi:hypothetical protein
MSLHRNYHPWHTAAPSIGLNRTHALQCLFPPVVCVYVQSTGEFDSMLWSVCVFGRGISFSRERKRTNRKVHPTVNLCVLLTPRCGTNSTQHGRRSNFYSIAAQLAPARFSVAHFWRARTEWSNGKGKLYAAKIKLVLEIRLARSAVIVKSSVNPRCRPLHRIRRQPRLAAKRYNWGT